ncbi:MAG: outer membrane protein assembly factor BamE [Gammaproteobacteria bacterium]|jgi:outer membrane protein assembly factor BamE
MRTPIVLIVLALTLSGCALKRIGIPKVHRIPIQQGNVITQDMVDKLKPGMTKRQVLFVMGEPVVKNPFHQDRWDYVYTLKPPGQATIQRRMTLFFRDDGLVRFTGDFVPRVSETPDTPPAAQAG